MAFTAFDVTHRMGASDEVSESSLSVTDVIGNESLLDSQPFTG